MGVLPGVSNAAFSLRAEICGQVAGFWYAPRLFSHVSHPFSLAFPARCGLALAGPTARPRTDRRSNPGLDRAANAYAS